MPLPRNAAVGALLGVHIGDSLGATVEFELRHHAAQTLPADANDVNIVGGGHFDWSPGDATDDTDLTVALARAYRDTANGTNGDVTVAAADHMLAWYQRGPRDVGGATASGLNRYRHSGDPYASGGTSEHSQGNGSLMRTMPVAIARADDPDLRATEAAALSAVTHAHPVCTDACVAYCELIVTIGYGADPADTAVMVADDPDRQPDVAAAMRRGLTTPAHELDGVNGRASGWVLTALALAVAAVIDPRPAPQVLVDIVRLGGDADTNGAIVGGALGARDGASVWPDRWIETLQYGSELVAAAGQLGA